MRLCLPLAVQLSLLRIPHRRVHTTRAVARSALSASPVQRVYDLAVSGDLDGAQEAMNLLTAEHAGMRADVDEPEGAPIGYHHVFSNDILSMSVFVLPAGACIPLHDHPSMSVLSLKFEMAKCGPQ